MPSEQKSILSLSTMATTADSLSSSLTASPMAKRKDKRRHQSAPIVAESDEDDGFFSPSYAVPTLHKAVESFAMISGSLTDAVSLWSKPENLIFVIRAPKGFPIEALESISIPGPECASPVEVTIDNSVYLVSTSRATQNLDQLIPLVPVGKKNRPTFVPDRRAVYYLIVTPRVSTHSLLEQIRKAAEKELNDFFELPRLPGRMEGRLCVYGESSGICLS